MDLWDELKEPEQTEPSTNLWDELKEPEQTEPSTNLWDELKEPEQDSILDTIDIAGDTDISLGVEDTVIPKDNDSTMTLGEVESSERQLKDNIEYPEQVVAGARQSVTLPLAKILEDSLDKVGLGIGHKSSEDLTEVNKAIDEYNMAHPDQVIHPATLGNIASQLAVPLAKSYKGVAVSEAVLNALNGIGKREDYDDVPLDATIGAAFGVTSMALFNKLMPTLGPLSYEAKLLIDKHPDLDEQTVLKALEGVPKADQAYALSNLVEDDFADFISKAVKPSNRDKLLLKKQLSGRTNIVRDTVGDTDKQVSEARDFYSKMIDDISTKYPNEFKFDSMVPKLDSLIKRYDKSPSRALSIVSNMRADLESGLGTMNVKTALQFRKDLNYLLGRASRHEEKALLSDIKSGVDTFLSKNLNSDDMYQVDLAISNYSRAMNNKDFVALMDKYTKQKSTDWVGLKKALKQERLSSPEVDNAIDIVKEFSTKFKNDKQLRSATRVTGVSEDKRSIFTQLSGVINSVRDTIIPYGSRYKELKIQEAILKSIRQAKDPSEVFHFMKANGVPQGIRKGFTKPLLLEYKPEIKVSGDVNLETMYATEKGTIGKASQVSDVALHDAQLGLVRESLGNKYDSDVIESVHKGLYNSKRFDDIVSSTKEKLKADDLNHNIKVVKNIITNEANELVRYIERSNGVKFTKKEAEKLVKMKLDDIMRDCK